jgi:hypothetical protein
MFNSVNPKINKGKIKEQTKLKSTWERTKELQETVNTAQS